MNANPPAEAPRDMAEELSRTIFRASPLNFCLTSAGKRTSRTVPATKARMNPRRPALVAEEISPGWDEKRGMLDPDGESISDLHRVQGEKQERSGMGSECMRNKFDCLI